MQVFWAFAIGVVAYGACGGGPSTPIAPARTAPPEARPVPSAPATLQIAAVAMERISLHTRKDKVYLDAGLFLYEARAEGGPSHEGVVLVGDLRDYAEPDLAGGEDLVGLATAPPKRHALAAALEKRIGAPEPALDWSRDGQMQCHPIPSADGAEYGTCIDLPFAKLSTAPADLGPPHWRGRFVAEARTNADGLSYDIPMAVTRDGALWFASRARLHRIAPDGKRTTVDLTVPETRLSRPHFTGLFPEAMSAVWDRSGGQTRYWQSTRLEDAPVELVGHGVLAFAPTRDGGLWIHAHASPKAEPWPSHASILYRYGSEDLTPVSIGSAFDQQVMVRNAGAARAWIPTCPQAFVSVTTSDESPLASAALARVLGEVPKKKIDAAIVEGILGTRPVHGVLLYHRAPGVDPKAFAASVASVVQLTGGEATCSVPVVTRLFRAFRGS